MKFFKSTLITFVTNILIFGVSVLTTIITSRMLGTDGRGVIGLANNVIAYGMLILGFGIESSNIYFMGKRKTKTSSILGTNLIIVLISIIVVVVIYYVNSYHSLVFLKGLDKKLIFVVLLIVPFNILKSSFTNALLGMQQIVAYNKINLIDRVSSLILLVLFILMFNSPLWVMISTLIGTILIILMLFFIIFTGKKNTVKFEMPIFKDMFIYGLKNQVTNIIQLTNYRLSIFIINSYLPLSQVGIYTNSLALGETMWQIPGSIATVIYPMTASAENKLSIKDFINKVTRVTLYLVIFCSIVLVFISKPLVVLLLGKDFIETAYALILLLPGISIFSVSKIISNYLAGIGEVMKNTIASSISCIATIILNLTLIPTIGIRGAAIATSISYVIFTTVVLFYYLRITKSKLSDILILKKEDVVDIIHYAKQFINKKLNKKS